MESNIIFLPCKNLEETLQFYTNIIGMKCTHKDEAGCIWLDSSYGYIGFCEYNDNRPMASGVCISFNLENTDAVDQKYQELLDKGINDLTTPQKHPRFSVYSFFFKDCNGYLLEFQKVI